MIVNIPLEGMARGFGGMDAAAFVAREYLGWFYVLARFRYFFDPSQLCGPCRWFPAIRITSLRLRVGGYGFNQDYVPTLAFLVALTEVVCGLLLILGLGTEPAAALLGGLTIYISKLTAKQKVTKQCDLYGGKPVDKAHAVECYLWGAEAYLIGLAAIVVCLGPGWLSMDKLVSWAFNLPLF